MTRNAVFGRHYWIFAVQKKVYFSLNLFILLLFALSAICNLFYPIWLDCLFV